MTNRIAIPTDPGELSKFASYFMATHGMPPIAGGETPGGTVTPAPPVAPDPATAAATPAPDPVGAAPATNGATPEGQPAEGAEVQPQGTPPEWAETLLERMDQIAPPQVDPLAAELFGQPQAAQPQQFAPQQEQPQPQQPGPQSGLPAQPGQLDEAELVRNFIDERAQQIAQKAIEERVTPVLQQQQVQRRREEALALTDEYPELRDPQFQSSLMTKARSWAHQILGSPEAAGEPGFLELCLLASRQLDAAAQASPAQPGQPGSEVPIEQPGGANPGSAQPQTDQIADRIVSAGARRGLSSLWQ